MASLAFLDAIGVSVPRKHICCDKLCVCLMFLDIPEPEATMDCLVDNNPTVYKVKHALSSENQIIIKEETHAAYINMTT